MLCDGEIGMHAGGDQVAVVDFPLQSCMARIYIPREFYIRRATEVPRSLLGRAAVHVAFDIQRIRAHVTGRDY